MSVSTLLLPGRRAAAGLGGNIIMTTGQVSVSALLLPGFRGIELGLKKDHQDHGVKCPFFLCFCRASAPMLGLGGRSSKPRGQVSVSALLLPGRRGADLGLGKDHQDHGAKCPFPRCCCRAAAPLLG